MDIAIIRRTGISQGIGVIIHFNNGIIRSVARVVLLICHFSNFFFIKRSRVIALCGTGKVTGSIPNGIGGRNHLDYLIPIGQAGISDA